MSITEPSSEDEHTSTSARAQAHAHWIMHAPQAVPDPKQTRQGMSQKSDTHMQVEINQSATKWGDGPMSVPKICLSAYPAAG